MNPVRFPNREIAIAVNDNDSRIASLEWERSHTVFTIEEALSLLPNSGVAIEDLLGSLQRAFDLTEALYRAGSFHDIAVICQYSKCWQNIAYLAASDDKGRLTAFEDHAQRMEWGSRVSYLFNRGELGSLQTLRRLPPSGFICATVCRCGTWQRKSI